MGQSEVFLVVGLSDNQVVNVAMAHSPELLQISKTGAPARGRDFQTRRFRDQAGLIDIYASEHTVALYVCINNSLDSGGGNPASESQRAHLLLGLPAASHHLAITSINPDCDMV